MIMNRSNKNGNSFALYCFSDDSASKSNTLSQFTCDLGSVVELDGNWQVGLKDAYFGEVSPTDDDDDISSDDVSNENGPDSITLPTSLNDQTVSLDSLAELLVRNSKNFEIYQDPRYLDKYTGSSMDYTRFPQYGFREGIYKIDYVSSPRANEGKIQSVIQVKEFLTKEQIDKMMVDYSRDNEDLDARQVILKIPTGKSVTLIQIVQLIIRYITSRHAPYQFSNESATRAGRDLERSMLLNAQDVSNIVHNVLKHLYKLITKHVSAKQKILNDNKQQNRKLPMKVPEDEQQLQIAFLYSDIIVPNVVSNKRSKLLALLPFKYQAEFKSITNVTFSNLEKTSFRFITFELRNYRGRLINFKSSTHPTILVLQFKKMS